MQKHKMSTTKIYNSWRCMRQRCKNPNHEAFNNYGGKGITVYKEWDESFLNFYNWAIQNGYEEGLTIDRLDSNIGYEPSNCRWITKAENTSRAKKGKVSNRKGAGKKIFYNGKAQSLPEWAEELDIPCRKLRQRLDSGMSLDKIFSKTNLKTKLYTANGISKSIAEWAKDLGIHEGTLRGRINSGWDIETALTTKNKWDK